MKVLKTEKQMKEVDVTVECHTLCDKCNNKVELDRFEAFEFKFLNRTGRIFPEGGGGEKQEMDLCQNCADELVELLRENGYRVTDSDWDC
jgi:hypothetical protein